MGYIYFINDGSQGYIGQASGEIYELKNSRMVQHYNAAVFNEGTDNAGLINLIRTKGWCNLSTTFYTAAENYGIPEEIYRLIVQKWNSQALSEDEFKLDLAEVLYIYKYQNSLASFNSDPGGQNKFVLKESYVQEFANTFGENSMIGAAVKRNAHVELFTKFSAAREDWNNVLYTLLYPEQYILQNVFQHEVLPQIWASKEMATFIKRLIVECVTRTKVQIQGIVRRKVKQFIESKMKEIAKQWNKELNPRGYCISTSAVRYTRFVTWVVDFIWTFYSKYIPSNNVYNRQKEENIARISKNVKNLHFNSSIVVNVSSKLSFKRVQRLPNIDIKYSQNFTEGNQLMRQITAKRFRVKFDKTKDPLSSGRTKMQQMQQQYVNYTFMMGHWAYFYDEQMNIMTVDSGLLEKRRFVDKNRTQIVLGRKNNIDIQFVVLTKWWDWQIKKITNNQVELMRFY